MTLSFNETLDWLREDEPERLEGLWAMADEVRRESVGDAVHLRGLVEFSNHCIRRCAYCGLSVDNRTVVRYRMTADEIMECARKIVGFGYGTIVLQSGEDPGSGADWLADLIRRVKAETPLAVTLSLGERDEDELRLWREAGADRYLLRFETSNPELYRRIHPNRPGRLSDRVALLRLIRTLGYEAGGGVMIGIPGQTYEDLARDITLFEELDLHMVGVGPYVPAPDTPLALEAAEAATRPAPDQVPDTDLMVYKVIALTRLACPWSNIPSTTALATINRAVGRELGLRRGANIVMPNLTPPKYRLLYQIYPAKAGADLTPEQHHKASVETILRMGRGVGAGRGDSMPH